MPASFPTKRMPPNDDAPSDASLVQHALDGEAAAFATLFGRYHSAIRQFAYRVVLDEHAADDVAQESFITAARRLGSLRDGQAFAAWLYRIAANAARTHMRSSRAHERKLAAAVAGCADDGDTPPPDERAARALAAMDGLPAKQRYEIAGFVWLQGFNDLVASDTYAPKPGAKVRDYTKYGEWLADFIRDVRKDVGAPKMPFVIGVLGVDGLNASDNTKAFREAMAAPALLPEFKGNVIAVETAPFWSAELGAIAEKKEKVRQMSYFLYSKHKDHANADGTMTEEQKREHLKEFEAKLISPAEKAMWERGASNAGYHDLGCAKTFALMGKAFAEATLSMMRPQERP